MIKELSFVFARRPLSKNKGTRTHARDIPTICYKISQINARSFTHNQCLPKGLKKIEKELSCEIQVSDANQNLIILRSTIVWTSRSGKIKPAQKI